MDGGGAVSATMPASFASLSDAERTTWLRRIIALADLTSLNSTDTASTIEALCARARCPDGGRLDPPVPTTAAVCVYPNFAGTARAALAGSDVRTACVAGAFPSGQSPLAVRVEEVRMAVADGAEEIDTVIERGAVLAGDAARVVESLRALREASRPGRLKVILETGELRDAGVIRRACDLVIEATEPVHDGGVFLKTSTGTVSPGATLESVELLARVIHDHARATGVLLGIKPAGGIREPAFAFQLLTIIRDTLDERWLVPMLARLGASKLVETAVAALEG